MLIEDDITASANGLAVGASSDAADLIRKKIDNIMGMQQILNRFISFPLDLQHTLIHLTARQLPLR